MESVHEYFNEIKKDVTKYCNNCDKDVLMFARLKDEQLTFKGHTVVVKDCMVAFCSICNEELFCEEFDKHTMNEAIKLWEKQVGGKFKSKEF
ncbi:YgiT-type zinc finger protein [Bacillus pumilus]|uniref:YgiT-type zinc finger protein n=1 Tax=Bacillus pumilus TaxID=1408 RepID=UPI003000C0B3